MVVTMFRKNAVSERARLLSKCLGIRMRDFNKRSANMAKRIVRETKKAFSVTEWLSMELFMIGGRLKFIGHF